MPLFFIDRPIFAWVVALGITLAGLLAVPNMPVAQYPDVAPPTINIQATYPGASAIDVSTSVASVIENELNGAKGLLYYESVSDSNGQMELSVTFEPGTDPDMAQVDVQNRISNVTSSLPAAVTQQGLKVSQVNTGFLLVVTMSSTDGSVSAQALADYITRNLQNPISRVEGVGRFQLFESPRAMRVWVDPDKLVGFNLSMAEVNAAISAQNRLVPGGMLGAPPNPGSQRISAPIVVNGELATVEEFSNIILRSNLDGSTVKLSDVARIEVGSDNYMFGARLNGKPTAAFAISLTPEANALSTAEGVKARMAELSELFPENITYAIPYDTSPYVALSIEQVLHTLLEAMLLVFVVMFIFLQNVRYTVIPALVVPVAMLGAFAVMHALGMSVNVLTMFAMVLAIGLLVDDAIVVVENVERIMSEEGLSPREATRKSMGQIQGALVGIAMVLSAVFIPMAFFGGTTGAIYRQFSITIVSAMVLSVLVAMILTPALCATLLKPLHKGEHHGQTGFFGWFNRTFNRNAERYEKGVAKILHRSLRWLLIYVLLLGAMVVLFLRLPTSFLPLEDRGMFITSVQLPSGSTQQQTLKVVQEVEKYYFTQEKDTVQSVFATVGSGPGGNGQNVARMFVRLKDWSERDPTTGTSFAIIERATKAFNKIKEARVFASSPPAISGLGSSAGFDMELQDHAGAGHDALMAARDQLLRLALQNSALTRVRHNGLDDSPQLQIDVDQRKAQALGVSIDDINDTLQTAWGSSYVNDFMDRGRVKKVYVQAAAKYRMLPDDINLWYVRNNSGGMVPFSAFATSRWETGSPRLERYNGYSAVEIVGEAAPGVSTGTAMDVMESLVRHLPTGFGLEWTAMSYQERLSGAQAPALYAISLLVVFLCLAALYESWSVPFSVMLVVPLGVIGALLATWMRGLENDVYFQVGLLTVIGLSAKNAILIVEFANEMNEKGHDLLDATLHACRQRLRPILMTSLAFIFGVLPMTISSGAGSGGQHAVGTGVMGGMISATVLAIYFVPLFFVLVRRRFPLKPRPE